MSVNFDFLGTYSALLVNLAGLAEKYFASDPNSSIIKLRQFAEILCQQIAARVGIATTTKDEFVNVLNALQNRQALDSQAVTIFHRLRKAGNEAVHQFKGDHVEALGHLRMAHQLGILVHRTFGKDPNFQATFIPPPDPDQKNRALAEQLQQLKAQLNASLAAAADQGHKRAEAEAAAQQYQLDLAQAQARADEIDKQLAAEQQKLVELQKVALNSEFEVRKNIKNLYKASGKLALDEFQTRLLIDKQLNDAGWLANTTALNYSAGSRPQPGQNMAIAEWPTSNGIADYALFVGLKFIGVVEAKAKRKDAASAIEQAKRYSRAYAVRENEILLGSWDDYQVPFLFATNGRPYLKEMAEKSGIWFLDVRRKQNHARPLVGWYTPEGLLDLLKQDMDAATQNLKAEALNYLPLREYQKEAIAEIETALARNQARILVAMATGTGKTQTAVSLLYRLIKAGRFRRALFLVDREALGEQVTTALKHLHLESNRTFTDIYDVKELGDIQVDRDTRLQVTTVQSLVRRIFYPSDNVAPLPVDQYDCIIVDECHRGYVLDQHMTEAEQSFRDEADYISKYNRILDHFDAIKIGLTATPALHTVEIFGRPVYQYSYRQAVIEGYLVDHEPPIRITTELAKKGITWAAGDTIKLADQTGTIDLVTLPDEVKMDLDQFNTQVVTENFNRVVCECLATYLDPTLAEKTLIFCATDFHADMVVRLLKQALDNQYGGIDDDAIVKITSAADRPLEKIKRFKNELMPNIAVTVDLMTTGIDVPKIANLVFIRRVKSRILYEQMIGRATRLCAEINKNHFRIFDAVDLYAMLKEHTTMKPVVAKPEITFSQLVQELTQLTAPEAQREVLEQLLVKFRRKQQILKKVEPEKFEAYAGTTPEQLLVSFQRELKADNPAAVVAWFANHPELPQLLDQWKPEATKLVISEHEDQLLGVEQGFGSTTKPADYLESFAQFVQANLNQIPALLLVTQRPRDLTRKQLKELKFELDKAGYSETTLTAAWRQMTNQDIVASIIGFIRNKALGSPLIAYEERVDRALKKILASRSWTNPQRKWLENICKQIKTQTIVDRDSFDTGIFKIEAGGYDRLNKVLEGQLDQVLADIYDALWQDSA